MQQEQSLFLSRNAEKFTMNLEEMVAITRGIKLGRSKPRVHHLARSRRCHQSHRLPFHIIGLVLSLLPVSTVKVIAFLSTIVVLPHTCAFSVSVSVSASIEDFDAKTLVGECDLSNCSHHHRRFHPPSSPGVAADDAPTPPRYVLKGFGGGGGSEGDHPDYSKSFVIGSALFNIFVGLKPRFFSPKFPIVGEIQPYFRWDPSIDEAIVRAAYDSNACVRYEALMHELRAFGMRPNFVTNEAWNRYREYWASADFMVRSEKASHNRKSEKGGPGTSPSKHTGGT
ncbi:hypothetical protein Scep_001566 [Stephania cephalantha]|uniref:Uncharacterized protein n=1 Tax=Stephania cephalantha TaxID=152367 RepID=A0AAP0Q3W4_9MAGN